MAQIPHQLIRQVQIRTRAAAGLPDYDPSDPTLPALPPLSATIAASDADASPPHRRCRNCKALLLRGSESIVCLYCGIGPHHDAVPDPICFTSTVGYQWLLRSLRLDGSEMVDPTSKSKQDKSQSSPNDLTPLSEFLNFKISWPAEIVKREITSGKHSEESKSSLILTGVAPDKFFLKSDKPVEQPSDHQWTEAASTKDVDTIGNQDLFQNVRSSKPAASSSEHKPSEQPSDHIWAHAASTKDVDTLGNQDLFQNVRSSKPAASSSEDKPSEAFSGWEADFQSADSENQRGEHASSKHVTTSSEGSEIEFHDPESFQSSSDLNVDLAAHLDSVFGPGEGLNDGKPNDSSSEPTASGGWNSDDMWNNLTSSAPILSDGFDATFSTMSDPQNDRTLDYSKDLSTSDDLFQDFQSQTNYADATKNKATNEEHTAKDELDYSNDLSTSDDLFQDFQSQTNYADATKKKATNEEHTEKDELDYSNDLSTSDDLFQDFQSQANYADATKNKAANEEHTTKDELDFSTTDDLFHDFQSQTNYADMSKNKAPNEEHTTKDDDFFDWNDFASSTSLQAPSHNAWAGNNDHVPTSEDKSLEGDFFSFDNTLEGDKKSSERDLFSFDNKFEGVKKSSDGDVISFDNKFEDDKKPTDLFGFDYAQPSLFSTSTSNSNAPTENSSFNWFDASSPSHESGQAADNRDAIGQSSADDVKMLISQMHDLSFMLETNLSIPSSSDDHKSVRED